MAQPGDDDYVPRRRADLSEPREVSYPEWEYEGMVELKSERSESPEPHPAPGRPARTTKSLKP